MLVVPQIYVVKNLAKLHGRRYSSGQLNAENRKMPSLNNLKIAFKVSLIVVLLAIVTVGAVAFATNG